MLLGLTCSTDGESDGFKIREGVGIVVIVIGSFLMITFLFLLVLVSPVILSVAMY